MGRWVDEMFPKVPKYVRDLIDKEIDAHKQVIADLRAQLAEKDRVWKAAENECAMYAREAGANKRQRDALVEAANIILNCGCCVYCDCGHTELRAALAAVKEGE